MKKTALLVLSASLLFGCSNPVSPSSSSSSYSSQPESSGSQASSERSYNPDWQPGPNALNGAVQPELTNPSGVYNSLGKMRDSQDKKGLPQSGEANILVVPVTFDVDAQMGYNFTSTHREKLRKAYFESEGGGKALPSVSQYYEQSSFGALTLSGVVCPALRMPDSFTTYMYQSLIYGVETVVRDIADYVYDYVFNVTKTYYDMDFDSDDDGKIDGLVLAYSWPTADALYGYNIYDYVSSFLTTDTFFGKELGIQSPINSITWTTGILNTVTGINNDSHIYIREVGKMMGLDSYDDYYGNGSGYYREPLAFLDMMDGSIGDHNPFSKYELGWIEPTVLTPSLIGEEKTVTLKPYEEDGSTILLSLDGESRYGEYLMLEYYTPEGLFATDSANAYPYNLMGRRLPTEKGVRVYKVDARLVEGSIASDVSIIDTEPDFEKIVDRPNGKRGKAYYDYAFGNDWINEYSDAGVYEEYPLIEELSVKGFNRHMVDYKSALTGEDMWKAGDTFGGDDSISGFYNDFAFDGNGNGKKLLGVNFRIDSIDDNGATITFRRAK